VDIHDKNIQLAERHTRVERLRDKKRLIKGSLKEVTRRLDMVAKLSFDRPVLEEIEENGAPVVVLRRKGLLIASGPNLPTIYEAYIKHPDKLAFRVAKTLKETIEEKDTLLEYLEVYRNSPIIPLDASFFQPFGLEIAGSTLFTFEVKRKILGSVLRSYSLSLNNSGKELFEIRNAIKEKKNKFIKQHLKQTAKVLIDLRGELGKSLKKDPVIKREFSKLPGFREFLKTEKEMTDKFFDIRRKTPLLFFLELNVNPLTSKTDFFISNSLSLAVEGDNVDILHDYFQNVDDVSNNNFAFDDDFPYYPYRVRNLGALTTYPNNFNEMIKKTDENTFIFHSGSNKLDFRKNIKKPPFHSHSYLGGRNKIILNYEYYNPPGGIIQGNQFGKRE